MSGFDPHYGYLWEAHRLVTGEVTISERTCGLSASRIVMFMSKAGIALKEGKFSKTRVTMYKN